MAARSARNSPAARSARHVEAVAADNGRRPSQTPTPVPVPVPGNGSLLDQASPMPRWAQIAQILRQRIAEQGSSLTGLSDQSLAREFGVSPLTVRQAVQDLVRSGLVTRHRGKGTFVAGKPVQGSVDHLEAFMSEWRIEGRDVRIEVLERSRMAASIPTAAALQIKPGQMVAFLHR